MSNVNEICKKCMNSCKQPSFIEMITCPRFQKSEQICMKLNYGKKKSAGGKRGGKISSATETGADNVGQANLT